MLPLRTFCPLLVCLSCGKAGVVHRRRHRVLPLEGSELIQCSAVAILKFPIIFKQRTPRFQFVLGHANFIAGPGHRVVFMDGRLYFSVHLTLGVI